MARRNILSSSAVGTVLSAFCFSAVGCNRDDIASKLLTPVRVVTASASVPDENIRYSANIVPNAQVSLAFKSGGYIDRIAMRKGADGRIRPLEAGDRVSKGEVLASVRQSDYTDRLAQAKAQLEQAKVSQEHAQLDFQRTSNLFSSASATKPQYDAAKANLDTSAAALDNAKAALAQAETAVNDASIRSPLDGWVLERDIEVGTLAAPSSQVFVVADTQFVKAVFGVPDTMMPKIKLGDQQLITTPAILQEFRGRVTSISPSADPRSRVFSVEVTIPNADHKLKSGMIATLAVGSGPSMRSSIFVPLSAVARSSKTPGGFAVFVVSDSGGKTVAHEREVKIGETIGNSIAVTEGLREGEKVVSVGVGEFKDGDAVQILP